MGLRYTSATLPVRHQPDNGISCQCSVVSCQKADNATSNRQPDRTRPETHQNLIHPDKEQMRRQKNIASIRRPAWPATFLAEHHRHDLVTFPRVTVSVIGDQEKAGCLITGHWHLITDLETTGFEPVTPCLQSRCSTS